MAQLLDGLSCEESAGPDSTPNRNHHKHKHNILNRRCVQFHESDKLHRYHEGPDVDILAAHRRDIWYQYEELKHIKRKALVLSKEAQRYGLGSILTNTYGTPNNQSQTQDALHTWVRNASSRRGLERWINDEYAAKRSDIRKRTIHSVLRAQMKMKESAITDPEYSMKVLSRLSEAFSVDSREFARGMGAADEKTSQLVYSEDEEGGGDTMVEDETDKPLGPPPSILKGTKKMDPHMLRKAPLRLNSPRTVIPSRPLSSSIRPPPGRRLGLSKETSGAADYRHFY
jgi:hypothetical protein